jgi:hypothetical protein
VWPLYARTTHCTHAHQTGRFCLRYDNENTAITPGPGNLQLC